MAISQVQIASDFQPTADVAFTVTFGSTSTSGNLIVVCITSYSAATITYAVTDNKGNTYTQASDYVWDGSYGIKSAIWYAKNITGGGGAVAVTVTPSSNAKISLGLLEVSGADTATGLDTGATGGGVAKATASSTNPNSGTVTPTGSGALFVGVMINGNLSTTTKGSAFTQIYAQNNSAGAIHNSEYLIQGSAAAQAADWTSASDKWYAHVAAFKAAGGDTTAPTLSSLTVPTGGTTLTATLSESGCTPTSGTGGFTLSGTSATVASWAISGTTLTLTFSGTVYSGETVTLTYSRAATTDDIHDAATNYLVDFSGSSVTNSSTQVPPLTAGTASFVSSSPSAIAVSATAPTNGTGSLSYQWERNASGGSYSDLSGATSLSLTDSTATAGTLYGYRCKQTKGAGTVTTNAVTAQIYTGGSITGGGGMTLAELQAELTTRGVTSTVMARLDVSVSSRLTPTVAGRTLDVSSAGEAGIDWANVGSPTTAVVLSGTTIKTATDVESDTADLQSRLPAALVSGNMSSYVADFSATLSASGTATAGAASTITLAVGSSAVNNYYNGRSITLVANAGAGQSRYIISYVGSTRVATVNAAWATNPDSTSQYQLGDTTTGATEIATAVRKESLTGTVVGSGTTTTLTATLVASDGTTAVVPTVADQLRGRIVIFKNATTTAALRGQGTNVTASTAPGSGQAGLTFTTLTTAPAAGDTFELL